MGSVPEENLDMGSLRTFAVRYVWSLGRSWL